MYANQGGQVHGVSSGALVRLASGLDVRCVKKQGNSLNVNVLQNNILIVKMTISAQAAELPAMWARVTATENEAMALREEQSVAKTEL